MAQAALANLDAAGIALPSDAAGHPAKIPATVDNGYYSEQATQSLEELGFDPYAATGRQGHHAPDPAATEPLPGEASAKDKMAAKLRTPEGKAIYARRKAIVEPVFGQIKGARGFRRFLLRGLAKVRGEWRLGCLTHNLLTIWRYGCAPSVN
jgi:hypothetical protein